MRWTSRVVGFASLFTLACSPGSVPVRAPVATPISGSSHLVVTTAPTEAGLRVTVTRWLRCSESDATVTASKAKRCHAKPAVGKSVTVGAPSSSATIWSATTDAMGSALAPWQQVASGLYEQLAPQLRVQVGRNLSQASTTVSTTVIVARNPGLATGLRKRVTTELNAITEGAWTAEDLHAAQRLLARWAQWLPDDDAHASFVSQIAAITRRSGRMLARTHLARAKKLAPPLVPGFALALADSIAVMAAAAKRDRGDTTVAAAIRELNTIRTRAVARIVASTARMRTPGDRQKRTRLIAEAALLAPTDHRVQTLLANVKRAAPIWIQHITFDKNILTADGTAAPRTSASIRMRYYCKSDHGSGTSSAFTLRRATATSTRWLATRAHWMLLRPSLYCKLTVQVGQHTQQMCWRDMAVVAAPCPPID